jgi:dihydrofolate synthase / folylpolyglutamate synthase
MSAPDSRAWLAHLEQFGVKLGLDTIATLMGAVGHPERASPVLHVAGTNGKGSVSAMVAHALSASGLVTARYTSPHLVRLEERFAVDGRSVSARSLNAALDEVMRAVGHLHSAGALAVEPTYFEATTAAAFLLFRAAGVDVAVIEVGLGGRYDATNIVAPLVTAITSVDFDHQAQLGTTLSAIAGEKAGTIKPGVPVVVGPLPDEAREVLEAVARAQGAPLVDALADLVIDARPDHGRYQVTITTPTRRYGPLRLALAGQHQVDNAVVAVRVLETAAVQGLPVSATAIECGLTETRWPARLEQLDTPRGRLVIDGAHNPAGARALASYLQDAHPRGLPLVVGVMGDKAADEMLRALACVAQPLVLTRAPGARAADPHDLAAIARSVAPGVAVIVEADIDAALACAWSHGPLIVVAGSLYLAGSVLARLGTVID